MKISSRFVGVNLKEYRTVVNWRNTMNYAAAIDDNNPYYFDDEQGSSIVAPPMYCVAATWPILEKLGEYIEVEDFPVEILRTQVHYSEYLQFHSPIKPGDELRIDGAIAAILPGRAGTRVVIRFEAVNQDGKPVFTEYTGGMMRGVTCLDEGAGGETLPQIPAHPESVSPIWEHMIRIDAMRPYIYDGCTNIVFPIHTSPRFAHQVGLPGIILHGTAALAYVARELLNRHGDSDPGKLQALGCGFSGMILPNTDIKIELLSCKDNGEFRDLFFRVLGSQDQIVIKNGYARMQNQ